MEERVLAEEAGVGRVHVCGRCDDVHVSMGSVVVRMGLAEFRTLARLFARAAAREARADGRVTEGRFTVSFKDGTLRMRPVKRRRTGGRP